MIYRPTKKDLSRLIYKKRYIKLSGDKIFYSIQGEGINIGLPSIFIRLHGCNLNCSWCDTKYTWDKNKREYWKEPVDITITKLYKEIKKYPCKHIVITGGEPLVQQDLITSFINKYKSFSYEIETNGTIQPNSYLLKTVQINCSPKLSNSKIDKNKRINLKVIKSINKSMNSNFKFVIGDLDDLEELNRVFVNSKLINKNKVIVMPLGTSINENVRVMKNVVDSCQKYNFRIIPRLQNFIWDNKRGI